MASPDLHSQLTARFEQLTPKQKRLAQFLLDNLYVAAFESANELAARLEVSAATVVRFSQALGYAGYPELQAAVRAGLPKTLTAAERGERALAAASNGAAAQVRRVFDADIRAVTRARSSVDLAQLETICLALAEASRILVLGAGVCSGVAAHLDHGLRLVGLPSALVAAGGIPLAVGLANLDEQSVVIGFGVWRYVKSVVNAMVFAKQAGARCFALTDSPVSPLAQHAELALILPTEGVGHTLSMAGMLALANAIQVMIAHLRPQQTLRSLRNVDQVYQFGDILLSD
ncbi:MAG: MurR/RpiR family transcriptional regulator [Caldilineales bacterium]|nr:MurR/RpiR family transcriptional regulator [Caldilineales bacterium]